MPTQVQIRGAAQGTQEARTLASRELDVNTTDKRLSVHDGTTVGGIPHVNCFDHQNQEYTYSAATGTDSLTITLAKAPAAYAAGQKFSFKAQNTNTGSATLNVNSLGAKTIKKASGGSLVALSAGDIVSGAIYQVAYDGTDLLMLGGGGGSPATQSDQETATSTSTFVSPGRQQYHPSAAKAWALISASPALLASYNITSVTNNGAGTETINIATDFSSANWCCSGNPVDQTFSGTLQQATISFASFAAGSVQVNTIKQNGSATISDFDMSFTFMAFGDQ